MRKYTVVGLVDATVCADVEAETPEQAIENAGLYFTPCHQCANEINVNDVVKHWVQDEDGNEVYCDARDAMADVRVLVDYLKNKKRLPAEIVEILKHY